MEQVWVISKSKRKFKAKIYTYNTKKNLSLTMLVYLKLSCELINAAPTCSSTSTSPCCSSSSSSSSSLSSQPAAAAAVERQCRTRRKLLAGVCSLRWCSGTAMQGSAHSLIWQLKYRIGSTRSAGRSQKGTSRLCSVCPHLYAMICGR